MPGPVTSTTPGGPAPADPAAHLDALVAWASARLSGDEVLLAAYSGERSDFVRFNHGAVRQAGSVEQHAVDLDLIEGRRHARRSVPLTGDTDIDRARVAGALDGLRALRAVVPDDPYLLYRADGPSTTRVGRRDLPDPGDAVDAVRRAGAGRDLVGLYSAGTTLRGFASSLGTRNWYEASTFGADWSFHLHGDKAAKHAYAGFVWDDAEFDRAVQWSVRQLEVLSRPALRRPPGRYRSYLAPAAMVEVLDLLAWGGFGLKAQRTRQTPLLRMLTEGVTLHPSVRITEDTAGGVAADFGAEGFTRPDRVVLVDGGRLAGCLVSPRSASEYDVPTNGASAWEAPESVAVDPGDLPRDRVLETLGTGLYIGNLWYLNYSDRAACRVTGMTRFATFWVEDGEIVAPVDVLRFDDSVLDLLGDRLVGLTDRSEFVLDSTSYGARSTGSTRVPGALVEDLRFTL